VRWFYLPALAPWLVRFVRAAPWRKFTLKPEPCRLWSVQPSKRWCPWCGKPAPPTSFTSTGIFMSIRSAQGLEKDRLAWELRRENGVAVDALDGHELRQLEPVLSREYVRGMLVRANGHTFI
jgi:D-amino-acid dehydrogenase